MPDPPAPPFLAGGPEPHCSEAPPPPPPVLAVPVLPVT